MTDPMPHPHPLPETPGRGHRGHPPFVPGDDRPPHLHYPAGEGPPELLTPPVATRYHAPGCPSFGHAPSPQYACTCAPLAPPLSPRRDMHGRALTPGTNADGLNIAAGIEQARQIGFGAEALVVIDYALLRWARGEEPGAEATIESHGINYTSWRMCLAAAMAAAVPPREDAPPVAAGRCNWAADCLHGDPAACTHGGDCPVHPHAGGLHDFTPAEPACPRRHRSGARHQLDRLRDGGWECPGIAPDGTDCGYQLTPPRDHEAGLTALARAVQHHCPHQPAALTALPAAVQVWFDHAEAEPWRVRFVRSMGGGSATARRRVWAVTTGATLTTALEAARRMQAGTP